MDFVNALNAETGLICVVGAGGKKTTMYALASRLDRSVVTATVRIPIFDPHVERVSVTDDPVAVIAASEVWPIGVVPRREGNRYVGYETATVDGIADAAVADAVLVKADGARMRQFKAPDETEPRLPSGTDTVIPIASAHIVGKPLTPEHVHRVEQVAAITGRDPGDIVRAQDVAAVLTSDRGGLKDVPAGASIVPLVNMVDDAEIEAAAREVAGEILDREDVSRVVLARMIADEPLVAVVE